MRSGYVHGYEEAEDRRLSDQAATLEALLHHDTAYPAGSTVLEAGCGGGAQTVPLVRNSPDARITCLDISPLSLARAIARVGAAGLPLPAFQQGDVRSLPFPDGSFDHAFVCFVLEHLADPAMALGELRRVLRPGGSLTVIEGDHGSALFHPDDPATGSTLAVFWRLEHFLPPSLFSMAVVGTTYPSPASRSRLFTRSHAQGSAMVPSMFSDVSQNPASSLAARALAIMPARVCGCAALIASRFLS